MNIRFTRARVALVAMVLGIGIAGVSYAAIPAANGTITACKDSKGTLRVIDAESGQSCAGSQQPLTWNQQGPQGAQGLAGPQGPQGAQGPATPVNVVSLSADASVVAAFTPQRPLQSAVRTGAGQYTITFGGGFNMTSCARWVSSTTGPRMFSVGHGGTNNFSMFVRAYDAAGALVDTGFTLNFSCPS